METAGPRDRLQVAERSMSHAVEGHTARGEFSAKRLALAREQSEQGKGGPSNTARSAAAQTGLCGLGLFEPPGPHEDEALAPYS